MSAFETKAKDFLAQKRIAVVGVSGRRNATGNAIFKSLLDRGYDVIPVNPNAGTVNGIACYPSVKKLPEKVDGAVIVTRAGVSEQVVRECVDAGIPRVWLHYNPMFGKSHSSASEAAAAYGREHGLTIIEGGCPLMFLDFPHKCMRWMLSAIRQLPA